VCLCVCVEREGGGGGSDCFKTLKFICTKAYGSSMGALQGGPWPSQNFGLVGMHLAHPLIGLYVR